MGQDNIKRVTPQEANRRVQSGEALLICAYDSDEKFEKLHLAGAISLSQFKARQSDLRREQGLIFYCA
ncbi:MAG: ArsR family transcriptional regulator [Desulfuromonas sp.]|nr:MAG: ArsR family transcriptional regulator [Desulfuromonas sp.]